MTSESTVTKYDAVSGHFTANSSIGKAEFKELLQKAIALLDFHQENHGKVETSRGFLAWRFYNYNEEEEQSKDSETNQA